MCAILKVIEGGGCLKIKLKAAGIRIVYKLVEIDGVMVIGVRADNEVYDIAQKGIIKF